MTQAIKMMHIEIVDQSVIDAFMNRFPRTGRAKAGRVISGILKSAARAGEISVKSSSGRVIGTTVWYEMSEQQLNDIRKKAILRAATIS